MLKDNEPFGSYSVDDIAEARRFYGETLGLETADGEMGNLELHLKGGANYFLYDKGADHRPASHTVLNFLVSDVEATVDALSDRGVEFQHHEGEIATDDKGILRGEDGFAIAWFSDPAGNTLSIVSG